MLRFRVLVVGVLVGLLGGMVADGAQSSSTGRFVSSGTVTSVVDGDTVEVALLNGRNERVRLLGIDTPERGSCYAAKATALTRSLAQGSRVVLKGDATQATRDRYNRVLAYVWLPGGRDLGYQLLQRGAAKVYVFDKPFQRLGAYKTAEALGKRVSPSVWACGRKPPPPPPTSHCEPSYPTICLDPSVSDYDCAGGSGNGPGYVDETNFRVLPPDPYGLDGDGNGVGCEE